MEKHTIDIPNLCSEIQRICPQNKVEYTGNGIKLNKVLINISGDLAIYRGTKLRFKNIFELVKQLRLDNVLDCSKEDLIYLSTRPSDHSHSL